MARPAAMVRGRVVDSAGKMREGVHVACRMILDRDEVGGPVGAGQGAATDHEGRFTIPGLPIGARCNLSAYNPEGGNTPVHDFAVNDTMTVDLGVIVLDLRGSRAATR